MKVLKKGTDPNWSTDQTCTGKGNGEEGCGAFLRVGQSDLFQTTSVVRENVREKVPYYVTFRCPECGEMTDIDSSVVPSRVKRTLAVGVKHPEGGWCHPQDRPDNTGFRAK